MVPHPPAERTAIHQPKLAIFNCRHRLAEPYEDCCSMTKFGIPGDEVPPLGSAWPRCLSTIELAELQCGKGIAFFDIDAFPTTVCSSVVPGFDDIPPAVMVHRRWEVLYHSPPCRGFTRPFHANGYSDFVRHLGALGYLGEEG